MLAVMRRDRGSPAIHAEWIPSSRRLPPLNCVLTKGIRQGQMAVMSPFWGAWTHCGAPTAERGFGQRDQICECVRKVPQGCKAAAQQRPVALTTYSPASGFGAAGSSRLGTPPSTYAGNRSRVERTSRGRRVVTGGWRCIGWRRREAYCRLPASRPQRITGLSWASYGPGKQPGGPRGGQGTIIQAVRRTGGPTSIAAESPRTIGSSMGCYGLESVLEYRPQFSLG